MSSTLPIKLTLLACASLTVMAGATIAPSLPAISALFADVPNGALLVKLILTIPALSMALSAPVVGYLVDRVGRRPVLLAGLILYALAGTSGLYLDQLYPLLIGRLLLGVSVALIMTASTTLVADYFQGPERNAYLGLQGAAMSYGGVLFLLAGGFLASVSWRGPFGVYALSILLVPAVVLLLREPNRPVAPVSTAAAPPPAVAIPWQPILLVFLFAFVGMTAFYAVPVLLPYHLKAILAASPAAAGAAIAVSNLAGGTAAIFYGRIRRHLGFSDIFALAFGLMTAGYLMLGTLDQWIGILPALAIGGAGIGLLMPNMNLSLLAAAPEAIRGRVVGGLGGSVALGQFLSPVFSAPLSTTGDNSIVYLMFAAVLAVLAALSLATRRVLPPR